jgi:hypothetical protein
MVLGLMQPSLGTLAGGGANMTAAQLAKQALADSTDTGLLGSGGQQSAARSGKAPRARSAQQAPQQAAQRSTTARSKPFQGVRKTPSCKALTGVWFPVPGSQQADMLAQQTGDFGSYGLAKTMEAANSAQGLSSAQQLATKGLANYLGANGSSKVGNYAFQMGAQNLLKQPEQPQPMQSRPAPGGSKSRCRKSTASDSKALTLWGPATCPKPKRSTCVASATTLPERKN